MAKMECKISSHILVALSSDENTNFYLGWQPLKTAKIHSIIKHWFVSAIANTL